MEDEELHGWQTVGAGGTQPGLSDEERARELPAFHPDTTPEERGELERFAASRGDDGPGVIREWNAVVAIALRRPIDEETARRVRLSADELESEGLRISAAHLRQRIHTAGETPQRDARTISAALDAWDQTRDQLMNLDRRISSVQPNPRQVPQKVRAVLDALRRADRTRPAWVELSPPGERMTRGRGLSGVELGEEPRSATWTERQLERTRAQARQLRAQLERVQAAAREARRSEPPSSPYQQAIQLAEEGATAILRPLSLAVATTTGPLQHGFGQGAGLGLALAALIGAYALTR